MASDTDNDGPSAAVDNELLKGSQLVVRMQYDDDIMVERCQLDDMLTNMVEGLQKRSLTDYDVTLGARHCSPSGCHDTAGSTKQLSASTTAPPNGPCPGAQGCGTALASCPVESGNYYAKTAVRNQGRSDQRPSTILVEIFLNRPKLEESDTGTQRKIIHSVTEAIDTCIIKKQKDNGKCIRICVLNFVYAATCTSKCPKVKKNSDQTKTEE